MNQFIELSTRGSPNQSGEKLKEKGENKVNLKEIVRIREPRTRWGMIAGLAVLAAFLIAACGTGADGLQVGDPAPDFELVSSDGETVALSDYEGEQPILLYFHMALG